MLHSDAITPHLSREVHLCERRVCWLGACSFFLYVRNLEQEAKSHIGLILGFMRTPTLAVNWKRICYFAIIGLFQPIQIRNHHLESSGYMVTSEAISYRRKVRHGPLVSRNKVLQVVLLATIGSTELTSQQTVLALWTLCQMMSRTNISVRPRYYIFPWEPFVLWFLGWRLSTLYLVGQDGVYCIDLVRLPKPRRLAWFLSAA